MVAQPEPPRWSVEDYLEMEYSSAIRHEFLDGHVYAMAGGSRRHSRLGVNVLTLLASYLRGRPCRVFNSDMKVRIDARHFVYPDAAVSCDSRDLDDEDPSFISFPALIVEVLSENSTADYDRGGKFDLLYSRLPSLREYMLLTADSVGIEIRRRGPTGDWKVDRYGPEDTVILESINGSFPVADFYL
jgi:Uma2 family endonuclease